MMFEKNSRHKKELAAVAIIILILGLLWAASVLIRSTENGEVAPYEVTLEGAPRCLPHRDTTGPQTLECAFGLQTDDGLYYALNLRAVDSEAAFGFQAAERIRVTGILTPAAALAEDERLQKYTIEGVIEVETLSEVGGDLDETHSFDGITIRQASNFGLAVRPEQVLVTSNIPPCDPDFDYCFYYNGTEYEGTNFESAGLRVEAREDLETREQCLVTNPDGYSNLDSVTLEGEGYETSLFSSIGDAGAGHSSVGNVYRLSFDETCYEFETRIGQAQLANFEEGTIEEFSEDDRAILEGELRSLLDSMTFTENGESIQFPVAAE